MEPDPNLGALTSETWENADGTFTAQLLDGHRCRDLFPQLNDFENATFGEDFECDWADLWPWANSDCLLYAAVIGEAVAGQPRILSVLSVFVTDSASRNAMLAGEIPDYAMAPWSTGPCSAQPTLYLSSVVSAAPQHLGPMYASLQRDVLKFQEAYGVDFHGGFGVAAGAAGLRHMTRSGFHLYGGGKYHDKYDQMIIDGTTAATEFWQTLLGGETSFIHRKAPTRQSSDLASAGLSMANDPRAIARELEKRLGRGKAARLRRLLDR